MTVKCKRYSVAHTCYRMRMFETCFAVLFLITVIFGTNSKTYAQRDDGGPVIVGARQDYEIKAFSLTDIQVAIEMLARYEKSTQKQQNQANTTDIEKIYTERLILSADAFIMHPNIFDMTLYTKFELTQENIDSDTLNRNERNSEFLGEYDFTGTLIRNGDLPITFYARQIQSKIDRQFSDSFDNVTTEYGARAFIKAKTFPTTLNIYERHQQQTDQRGTVDYELTQDTFEWSTRVNAGSQHRMYWDYSYDSISETGNQRPEAQYDRHDATLRNDFFFGSENQHDLRSWINAYKQVGDYAYDRLRIDERIRLRHTKSFETDYQYLFNGQERAGLNQTQHRVQVGLIHHLYDSLTSTANVGASTLDQSDGFTSDENFGDAQVIYRKIVPYGRLLANINVNYNKQENGARSVDLLFIDERYTFNDPNPVIINKRNVIQNSIVVTDLLGLKFFIEGIDYSITDFIDHLEINRLITGDILDGDSVLIDYRVGPEPGNILTSVGTGLGLRYDIEDGPLHGLALFSRYNNQTRNIEARDPEQFHIGDVQDFVYGAEYRFWRIRLSAEQQIHDSTYSPYQAFRFNGQYSHRVSRSSAWFINADHQTIDYDDDNSTRKLTTISGRWYEQLTSKLSMNVRILWRLEENSNTSSTEGFEQKLELDWQHRQTHLYLRANNSFVNTDTSDNNFQALELGYRRDF